MPIAPNRRIHPRFAVGLDCKLRRFAEPKYDAARTGDVSAGGACLDVRTARPIRVGEALAVAVNWADRPVLASGDLVKARVVRAGPMLGNSQRVAICFDEPQTQAARVSAAEAA